MSQNCRVKTSYSSTTLYFFCSCDQIRPTITKPRYQWKITKPGDRSPPTDPLDSSPNSNQFFPNSNNDHLWRLLFTIFSSLIKRQVNYHPFQRISCSLQPYWLTLKRQGIKVLLWSYRRFANPLYIRSLSLLSR